MRKTLLFAAALLALPTLAQAQVVNVTATVQKYLLTAKAQDLAFGNLTHGALNTVAANDLAKAGQVRVAYNSAVNIVVPASGTIAHASLAGVTLAVGYTCATVATDNAYAIGGNTWSGAGSDCSGGATLAAPTAVAYALVGVGGSITQAAVDAAPAGNYSGTVTVVVTEP